MMQGRRIIFVLWGLALGGAEKQAILLARYLQDDLGANVTVVGFGIPEGAADLCDSFKIPWKIIDMPRAISRTDVWLAALRLRRELARLRPDILMPYLNYPNTLCGLTWRWTGATTCIWNQRNGGDDWDNVPLARMACRNTPVSIANSQHGREFLLRTTGLPGDRVHVVNNGVWLPPASRSPQAWRESWGVDASAFVACMVAHFRETKDHRLVLRAWRRVVDRLEADGRAGRLILPGRPDQSGEACAALVQELGLQETVRMPGVVDDTAGLLSAVDLGLLTSAVNDSVPEALSEGVPNAVLEYLEAGLPVVGSDVAGIREATAGAESDVRLVPVGDVEAMAAQILAIAEVREARPRPKGGGAPRQFALETMCRGMTEVMSESFQRRRRDRPAGGAP